MAINNKKFRDIFAHVHLTALRLVFVYAVVAGLYIFTSDKILATIIREPEQISWLQTVKGLVFVAVTSLMLYALVSSYLRRLKKAHDELAESENTFATAFHSIPESFSITTLEPAIYTDINESFTKFLGYSREEAVGNRVPDTGIWCDPQQRTRIIKQIETERQVVDFETRLCAKDGTIKDTLISAALVHVHGQKCMIAIAKDITQIKAARLEREQTLRELAAKNKELESIIYVASHDLRSALVNIQGFSRELGMTCDRLKPVFADPQIPDTFRTELHSIIDMEIPETVNFIISSTSKIDILLTGLLKISHLGRQLLDIQPLNMDKLVADVIKSQDFQIAQSGAKVTVEHLSNCRGDASMVSQVFENLLSNAVKYLDPTRPGIIHISSEKTDSVINYCVEDNGIGIDPQFHDKIFEIFHRLNPSESTGDGLGLNIIKEIMERHNGKVWVKSQPGAGSKFFVSFAATE